MQASFEMSATIRNNTQRLCDVVRLDPSEEWYSIISCVSFVASSSPHHQHDQRRGLIQRSTSRRQSQRRSSDELPPQHVLPNRHWIELEELQHEKNCDERHFHELLWYGYVRCVLEWLLLQRQITTIDPLLSWVNQFRKIEHNVVSILAFKEIPSSHGDPKNQSYHHSGLFFTPPWSEIRYTTHKFKVERKKQTNKERILKLILKRRACY